MLILVLASTGEVDQFERRSVLSGYFDGQSLTLERQRDLLRRVGARVQVTLKVDADVPGGVPENVVRTVTENSRTLKFSTHGFEKE